MRVLHINLARGWRGGERQTLLLMQSLRACGVESVLVARAGEPLALRALEAGIEVIELRRPWILRGLGLGSSIDVVHAHEAHALQVAAFWKWINHRPLVATRRVVFVPSQGVFTRFKYRQADRVVAISQGVRTVMAAWGVPIASLQVIHSALPIEDLSQPGRVAELRERFAGRKVIGCVASLTAEKDHATLLRAAKRLGETCPEAIFVLLGDGKLRADLEAQTRELGLTNIAFEGYQQDPYSYYKVFDAFVLCSREEGLGSSILDAFVYGVPVVATRAGGIPEIVIDGSTGILAAVGDDDAVARGLAGVLADGGLRDRLCRGARDLLERDFTVEHMAKQYNAIYNELAENRSTAR